MKLFLTILFSLFTILFGMGAIGEIDIKIKTHYIMSTCFLSGLLLILYVLL